jgi:4-hydroxybutyrate CoA-transferase
MQWTKWGEYDRNNKEYRSKLVSAEDAAKLIKSGDKVFVAWGTGTPTALCNALCNRQNELEGVKICETMAWCSFPWHKPGTEKSFTLMKSHLVGVDHDALEDGRKIDFYPWIGLRGPHEMAEGEKIGGAVGIYDSDVFMVRVSAPDEYGFCSYGDMVWASNTAAEAAKLVIAEVNENVVRTYGDNHIHVSQIDYFVENLAPVQEAGEGRHAAGGHVFRPPRTEEETLATEVIGETIASELIQDGDTLQMGIGQVSAAIPAFLRNKHDLGIHSEGYPGMIIDLVKEGIVTGKRKSQNPGKVVSTTVFMATPQQLSYMDNNPVFELRELTYTNSLRTIMAHDNMVSINNAVAVDLTGQIDAESIGPRLISSSGGQTDFTIGSQLSRGGRAVTVLPSVTKGGKVSRIVAGFEPGTVVTIPKYYADRVVTEYGIASLRGKSIRQRVNEMIAVAHPDFRAELTDQAKRLYGQWL